jgi:hypothetical protein
MNELDPQLQLIAPALCLPDDRKDWATWLEKQILSLQLTTLVEQLITLGSKHPPEITFQVWMANDRANILKYGLQQIDLPRIELLVRNPALLLDLQKLVLLEGEEYWLKLPRSQSQIVYDKTVLNQVAAQIDNPQAPSLALSDTAITNKAEKNASREESSNGIRHITSPSTTGAKRSSWLTWTAIAATAAAILLAVFNPFLPAKQEKFFAAVELQTPTDTPQLALNRMAQRVQSDWQRNLNNRTDLQQQLLAFRDSCDFLIDGPLVQTLDGLPINTIEDVRNRCRKWKTKATELIASLEAGASLDTIQQEADKMIETLTNKLREIAQS